MERVKTPNLRRNVRVSRKSVLAGAALSASAGAGLLPLASVAGADTMTDTSAEALGKAMRKLWEDHITWTRLYIVSFAADLPDLAATTQRLLRNQSDIGNAIKPYYGQRAGKALTALLRQHILGAADLLAAVKVGNTAGVAKKKAAWYANGNQIARFLHDANPHEWALRDMQQMMRRHLDLTLEEAVAHLEGRYHDDIKAYDRVHGEILIMADMLTAGIVARFPRLSRGRR